MCARDTDMLTHSEKSSVAVGSEQGRWPPSAHGVWFLAGKWLGADMVGWVGIKGFVLFLRWNIGAGCRPNHLSALWPFLASRVTGSLLSVWSLGQKRPKMAQNGPRMAEKGVGWGPRACAVSRSPRGVGVFAVRDSASPWAPPHPLLGHSGPGWGHFGPFLT